jgi:protein O-mannosyl-transferase
MAKKQNAKPVQNVAPAPSPAPEIPVVKHAQPEPLSIYSFKVQAIIVAVLAFVFYFNTFFNEFAHDDGIVIVKNEYVLEGFAGISNILTKDAYDSYYRQLNTTNQLNGGRYRPLSIVTFAIEQQFLGAASPDNIDSILKQNITYGVSGPQEKKLIHDMHVRHIFNVLWYMLSVVVLLYFLRYIVFKSNPLMAFIAAILFTIHPIHTEVVANVKSRDEIMSLLFMCLTFIFTFKYYEEKKIKMLIAALVSYFLAFLSKEYAITLVVLLPLSLYIFNNFSIKKSLMAFIPFLGVIVVYIAMRFHVVAEVGGNSNNEVLNNPYLFASDSEKLATEIATSLNYLKLLIFPHPLSADYSYDSIPYKDFSNPLVWLSLIVHGGLIAAMFLTFRKRSVLCFAIMFYLLHLALVCNIIFDIGATMGERLIYHSSVGFVIAVAYFLCKGAERVQDREMANKALAGFMIVIIILSGYKTIARNADWKNDYTLFQADLKVVPNSVLVNANVAASYITIADQIQDKKEKDEYLQNAIKLLNHALLIHPKFVAAFLNRGIAWYKLGEIDKAKPNFDTVARLYPTYPTLPGMYKLLGDFYMRRGWDRYGKVGKYAEAVQEFQKGIAVDSTNAEIWYNMGGAYFSNHQFADAIESWKRTIKIRPDYPRAQDGMRAAMSALQAPELPDSGKTIRDKFWLTHH